MNKNAKAKSIRRTAAELKNELSRLYKLAAALEAKAEAEGGEMAFDWSDLIAFDLSERLRDAAEVADRLCSQEIEDTF